MRFREKGFFDGGGDPFSGEETRRRDEKVQVLYKVGLVWQQRQRSGNGKKKYKDRLRAVMKMCRVKRSQRMHKWGKRAATDAKTERRKKGYG